MNFKKILKAKMEEQNQILNTALTENRGLAEEEQIKIDNLEAEIKNLEKSIEVQNKLSDRDAEHSTPVNEPLAAEPNSHKPAWNRLGDMLIAVANAARSNGTNIDKRLLNPKNQLGVNEGVPSEGGFLVGTDHAPELLKRTYETGVLSSRVRKVPISTNANGLTINAIAENNRTTGNRFGGVQSYWLHEAGAKTPTNPTFRQMELKLKKLIGLCYSTDELLQDAVALENIIREAFAQDFAWMIDNAIFRGNGVGQPLGITGNAGTVVVNAEAGQAANTILYENIVNMWSRCLASSRNNAAWFINQDIEPQLFTMSLAVGVGGVPVYMPASGASASPFGTLFGRPVVPIEQASTLGTVGDITLGDFSQYLMIDKGGIQPASSIHVQFVTDQTAFRFVYRCDGQPMWDQPLTPANGGNTLSPFVQLATRP